MNLWHDPATSTLIYETPEPELILQNVRGSFELASGHVVVPISLYNMQLLRYLQLPVIPFLDEKNYDWPIKAPFRPRDHQRAMTNFMLLHPRCFNLSDMGTMKTLAALWAADYVMETEPGTRTLIVCPVSIMQRTWGDAIFTHLMGLRKYVILSGDAKRREKLLSQPADFYIVNFDGVSIGAKTNKRNKLELGGLSQALAERQDIRVVIVDEADAYRDSQTRRHRVARRVFAEKPYLWIMTGTPAPNGPLDAYGIARLHRRLSESFTDYKSRVMVQMGKWKWFPRVGAHEEAFKLMQPSIRFEMRDCTDVPPCTEQMRDVELSAEQAEHYKALKRDLVLELKSGKTITAAHEAALRLKLIQISCGAIYDHDHTVTRIDATPRLDELREVIRQAQRKVIVFAPLTSVVELLYNELREWSRAMINGNVKPKVRDEVFRMFQQEETPHVLIADPGTMSHGLDLFAASVVVWYGPTDRTGLYLQANRRIDRPGQNVCTTIVQLASTPVEREIYRRISGNQSVQGAILDLVKGG